MLGHKRLSIPDNRSKPRRKNNSQLHSKSTRKGHNSNNLENTGTIQAHNSNSFRNSSLCKGSQSNTSPRNNKSKEHQRTRNFRQNKFRNKSRCQCNQHKMHSQSWPKLKLKSTAKKFALNSFSSRHHCAVAYRLLLKKYINVSPLHRN